MIFRTDAAIEHLALRMIDTSLPKSEWTHEGHFAAALWLCRHREDLTGPDEIRRLIMRYNDATGTANTDTSGYHHSITLASMRAVADLLRRLEPGTPLCDALGRLMASDLGNRDWLLKYWRRETLFGAQARKTWVEPDRAKLPF